MATTRKLIRLVDETLAEKLSEITDIPLSRIFAKIPDPILGANKPDGPNTPAINPNLLPAIGITDWKNAEISRNRISGYRKTFPLASGLVCELEPRGEQKFFKEIHVFSLSKKQNQELINEIIQWIIMDNTFWLSNDVASDYCSIAPHYTKDYNQENNPNHSSVCIELCGSVYKEATGVMVNNMFVRINTGINQLPETLVNGIDVQYDVDGFVDQIEIGTDNVQLSSGDYDLTEFE